MVELGIIGNPLGHSFSPGYFSSKFMTEGIEGRYDLFPIQSIQQLPSLLQEHTDLRGFNVTIPYKQQVLDYMDEIDEAAAEIGAVNTVKLMEGRRKAKGYNTDWIGFKESLMSWLGEMSVELNALILGTGGASKAVAYALKSLGIKHTFVSRDSNKKVSAPVIGYNELTTDILSRNLLIINTTPLGMYPRTDEAPVIPYDMLSDRHCCYDLIYNPEKTKFLALSEKQGARIKNGLEMLHRQAEEAWKIWTL